MKFLCDQMLIKLGRWLRMAGYDTVIVDQPCQDREILEQSLSENRFLITRDRHFLSFTKEQDRILWLNSNRTEDCIHELNQKIEIQWTYKPFSRCSLCNASLHDATQEEITLAPEGVREWCKKYWYCQNCMKLYWHGSHTEKMLKQLQNWQST